MWVNLKLLAMSYGEMSAISWVPVVFRTVLPSISVLETKIGFLTF